MSHHLSVGPYDKMLEWMKQFDFVDGIYDEEKKWYDDKEKLYAVSKWKRVVISGTSYHIQTKDADLFQT